MIAINITLLLLGEAIGVWEPKGGRFRYNRRASDLQNATIASALPRVGNFLGAYGYKSGTNRVQISQIFMAFLGKKGSGHGRSWAIAGLGLGLIACQASPPTMMTTPPTPVTPTPMVSGMGKMDLGPKDQDFDLRFIDGMTLHHEGAIAMAQQVLSKSQRSPLQGLAQNIIQTQTGEIRTLGTWRKTWYPQAEIPPLMYDAAMGHTMAMTPAMATAMRMDRDLGPADGTFDQRFLAAMIAHHEGALAMAQQALVKSDRPETIALAKAIVTAQTQEIQQMKQWQRDWATP